MRICVCHFFIVPLQPQRLTQTYYCLMNMKKHLLGALCLMGALLGTFNSCEPNGPEKDAEVYATLSEDGNTMTLYCDTKREKRGGVTDWSVYNNDYANNPAAETNHVKTIILDESLDSYIFYTMASWFAYFSEVDSIKNMERLWTGYTEQMDSLFYNCSKLKEIDLRNWSMQECRSCSSMFSDCSQLKTIYCNEDMSSWDPETTMDMFLHCTSLVGGKGTRYNENHTGGEYARPDGIMGEKGYFTGITTELYGAFDAASGKLTLYYDNRKDTHNKVMHLDKMALSERKTIKSVEIDLSVKNYKILSSTERWFANMSNMESINGLENIYTSNLEDVSYMFMNCSSLKTIDIRGFSFMNATTCESMFIGCNNLKIILCNEDYSASTTMKSNSMFNGCTSLVGGNGTKYNQNHIDASYARPDIGTTAPGYFTGKMTFAKLTDNGATMTLYCSNNPDTYPGELAEWTENGGTGAYNGTVSYNLPWADAITSVVLDASMKDARPVSLYQWFGNCRYLERIEHLEYLNTSETTIMNRMFYDCHKITELDLRSFDVHKLTDGNTMFANCSSLETIYCNDDWSQSSVLIYSNQMFHGCYKLVGGKGTVFDSSKIKKAYAHPDGGPSNPGYFTQKE